MISARGSTESDMNQNRVTSPPFDDAAPSIPIRQPDVGSSDGDVARLGGDSVDYAVVGTMVRYRILRPVTPMVTPNPKQRGCMWPYQGKRSRSAPPASAVSFTKSLRLPIWQLNVSRRQRFLAWPRYSSSRIWRGRWSMAFGRSSSPSMKRARTLRSVKKFCPSTRRRLSRSIGRRPATGHHHQHHVRHVTDLIVIKRERLPRALAASGRFDDAAPNDRRHPRGRTRLVHRAAASQCGADHPLRSARCSTAASHESQSAGSFARFLPTEAADHVLRSVDSVIITH